MQIQRAEEAEDERNEQALHASAILAQPSSFNEKSEWAPEMLILKIFRLLFCCRLIWKYVIMKKQIRRQKKKSYKCTGIFKNTALQSICLVFKWQLKARKYKEQTLFLMNERMNEHINHVNKWSGIELTYFISTQCIQRETITSSFEFLSMLISSCFTDTGRLNLFLSQWLLETLSFQIVSTSDYQNSYLCIETFTSSHL